MAAENGHAASVSVLLRDAQLNRNTICKSLMLAIQKKHR